MLELVILPDAKTEVEEAATYYFEIEFELGIGFMADYEHALNLIQEHPYAWQIIHDQTRHKTLTRFPYRIIYRINDREIRIIALTNYKQKPDYWRQRKL